MGVWEQQLLAGCSSTAAGKRFLVQMRPAQSGGRVWLGAWPGLGVVRGLGVRWLESSMSLPGFFLPVHNQVRTCKCQVLEVTLEQEHAWSQGVYFCLGAIPKDLISGAAPLARAVWEAGEQARSG